MQIASPGSPLAPALPGRCLNVRVFCGGSRRVLVVLRPSGRRIATRGRAAEPPGGPIWAVERGRWPRQGILGPGGQGAQKRDERGPWPPKVPLKFHYTAKHYISCTILLLLQFCFQSLRVKVDGYQIASVHLGFVPPWK